jgi:hypothetical protein
LLRVEHFGEVSLKFVNSFILNFFFKVWEARKIAKIFDVETAKSFSAKISCCENWLVRNFFLLSNRILHITSLSFNSIQLASMTTNYHIFRFRTFTKQTLSQLPHAGMTVNTRHLITSTSPQILSQFNDFYFLLMTWVNIWTHLSPVSAEKIWKSFEWKSKNRSHENRKGRKTFFRNENLFIENHLAVKIINLMSFITLSCSSSSSTNFPS